MTLLERGVRVALPYRNPQSFRALSEQAAGKGFLWGGPCELDREREVQAFMDEAASRLEGINGLACIAGGYAGSGALEVMAPGEWGDMIRANLETTRLACQWALPHLLKSGGSVVTVGSRLVETGGAGSSAYVVSKAAVMALTRVLALENKDRGVRFNCVLPGIIDTDANRRAMGEAQRARWTPPEEIARTIAFLLSPDSVTISGALIPVDGRGR